MVIKPWIEQYILLALRIDRLLARFNHTPFVDYFYGPEELKAIVSGESVRAPDELQASVLALIDSLPVQDFTKQRSSFLKKHLLAMESICRLPNNPGWVLRDEIETCLDIQVTWTPEEEFEQMLKLLHTAILGKGSLRERYREVQTRTILPAGKSELALWLTQRMLDEISLRTRELLMLPDDETLDLHIVHGKSYGAANWYLGDYRSRLEINADRPINIFNLLYQMCHEAYPGHHTEFVLKEKHLYREKGYTEQSIFILGPQLVIAEGIASEAIQIIFTPEEIASWIIENVLSELEIVVDDIDLPKLIQFSMTGLLDDIGSNLVLMLQEGQTEEQTVEHILAYTPYSEEQARSFVQSLNSPLKQIYALTYSHGKKLLQPLLQGDNRIPAFRRLLTEQVYPSLLLEWAE